MQVVRKHRRSIALAGFVGFVGAAMWTFTRTPLYEATTQIEVVGSPQDTLTREMLLVEDEKTEFATHKYHLTSERILDKAAASLNLGERLGEQNAKGKWIGRRLTVERVPDTRIFRITARAPEPALAADIANAVAAVYEKDDVDRRSADAKKKLAWLDEQMTDVKGQVETSELALIQYMETASMDLVDVPSSGGDPEKGSADLALSGSTHLRELEGERGRKQLQLDRERLDKTEANPDVKRLLQELDNLDKRIAAEKKRVTEENKKRIRYSMLRRDAELNRQLFHVLMKELKEVNLVGDDDGSRIEKLRTAAANERPVYPKPAQHLALGLAAGLLFGIGLAFLQETLDRTLKSREEIERLLGLPVLGVVHRVGASRRTTSKAFLAKTQDERFVLKLDGGGAWAPEVEDFRTLRTNLRFARPDGENRTLLVTSTVPEEGKTTIATNLGVVMAQAGERVLLVDADLRRPAVHLALELQNEKGLTNLLVEGGKSVDVIQPTSAPNLFVISAGAFAPNPPDILESARMRELIAEWRGSFDRVIIDSPPQTSVVDPSILAPLVDGVLLVVSSGRVDADRARQARRQLGASGARFYGCVVNHIQRGEDPYSYGYGYGGYGYGGAKPDAAPAPVNGNGNGHGANGNGDRVSDPAAGTKSGGSASRPS